MKMRVDTAQALWESIQHWYENWEDPFHAYTQDDACALCMRFVAERCYNQDNTEWCPVARETGYYSCAATPWKRADFSLTQLRIGNITLEECSKAIEAEYAYLVSLAPDPEEVF